VLKAAGATHPEYLNGLDLWPGHRTSVKLWLRRTMLAVLREHAVVDAERIVAALCRLLRIELKLGTRSTVVLMDDDETHTT
jgi:hypothetical protein